MKKLLSKVFNLQNLILLAGMLGALGVAYFFVTGYLIPKTLEQYGITPETVKALKEADPDPAAEEAKTPAEGAAEEETAPGADAAALPDAGQAPEEKKRPEPREIGPTYDLQPIVVNVAGSDARRFLKTQMVLELNDAKLKDEIEKRSPQIYDLLIEVLSAYRVYDLTDNNGRDRIRAEVMDRLNIILTTGEIVNVYLNELVIQ